ncbi:hypothetical protein HDU85_001346 [Gaertneriomyces sp. JEL0708]|nr:hypothetical protein HDU85_001346 [Gaertneriomyces sp. JEL0708]
MLGDPYFVETASHVEHESGSHYDVECVSVKVKINQVYRRFQLPFPVDYETLLGHVHLLFEIPRDTTLKLWWTDDDGDDCMLEHEIEFREAIWWAKRWARGLVRIQGRVSQRLLDTCSSGASPATWHPQTSYANFSGSDSELSSSSGSSSEYEHFNSDEEAADALSELSHEADEARTHYAAYYTPISHFGGGELGSSLISEATSDGVPPTPVATRLLSNVVGNILMDEGIVWHKTVATQSEASDRITEDDPWRIRTTTAVQTETELITQRLSIDTGVQASPVTVSTRDAGCVTVTESLEAAVQASPPCNVDVPQMESLNRTCGFTFTTLLDERVRSGAMREGEEGAAKTIRPLSAPVGARGKQSYVTSAMQAAPAVAARASNTEPCPTSHMEMQTECVFPVKVEHVEVQVSCMQVSTGTSPQTICESTVGVQALPQVASIAITTTATNCSTTASQTTETLLDECSGLCDIIPERRDRDNVETSSYHSFSSDHSNDFEIV